MRLSSLPEAFAFAAPFSELRKIIYTPHIYVINLNIEGEQHTAILKEIQFHPVTDVPIHVDFVRVQKGGTIHASIPLHFINEEKSPGIKKGGVLNITVHNLEVTCSVDKMPEHIEIDLDGLDIHGTVHLVDVKLPAGVVALHPERDHDIANIVAPTVMKQTAEEATATEEKAE